MGLKDVKLPLMSSYRVLNHTATVLSVHVCVCMAVRVRVHTSDPSLKSPS